MLQDVLEEISGDLLGADNELALTRTLQRACRRLGFDHFALSLESRSQIAADPLVLLHDYPDRWAQIYLTLDLGGKDPVRRACDRSVTGFEWKALERLVPLTPQDRRILLIGSESGVSDGYTVPRHLPGEAKGTCSFVVGPRSVVPKPVLVFTEVIGALALASAIRICGITQVSQKPKLSDRQRDCLLWSARGKTAAETAIILAISEETVIQHLKMARERYGVHCRQSLILFAISDGVIGLGDIFQWLRRT